RQIVDALEARPALGGCDSSGPEQPFERRLGVAPAPPAAMPALAVEIRGGERAALYYLAIDTLDVVGIIAAEPGYSLVDTLAARRPLHAPAHQRPGLDRQERCLVRPVFEEQPLPALGRAVDQRERIGAEPGKHRHIVRPDKHVHGIHLQKPVAGEHLLQVAAVGRTYGPRLGKALCGNG